MWVSRLGDPGERLSFLFLDGLMGVGLTLPLVLFTLTLILSVCRCSHPEGALHFSIAGVDTPEPPTAGSELLGRRGWG